MQKQKNDVAYVFINGLGHGVETQRYKAIARWWQRAGIDLVHAHIDWYDGKSLQRKMTAVGRLVDDLLKTHRAVVLIGASAGGSLAVNVYADYKRKKVAAVIAHGRLRVGIFPSDHHMSLYRRAKLHTELPSQSFYDSVVRSETLVIPKLTDRDKTRLLTLTQYSDGIVPLESMTIEGVHNHRSKTLGHSGGFVAHLIACRNMIIHFANDLFGESNK